MRLTAVLLTVVGACGGTNGDQPDAAATPDAFVSSDAGHTADAGDPPEVGPVTITVANLFGASGPIASAPVLFFTPGGELSGQTLTDDQGVATGVIESGSTLFIAAGGPFTTSMHFYTAAIAIVDAHPGDDIHFSTEDDRGAVLGSMTIDLPAYPGGSNYLVDNGCDNWGSGDPDAVALTFRSGCVTGGRSRILANVRSSTGGNLAYLRGEGTFEPGGVLSLEEAEWVPYEWAEIDIVPGRHGAAQIWSEVVPAIDRRNFTRTVQWNDVRSVGLGESVTTLAMPTTDLADARVFAMSFRPLQSSTADQGLWYARSGDTDSIEVALADELLPWLGTGIYSRADRSISWARTGGRMPDAQYATLIWFNSQRAYDASALFIVAPPDRSRIEVPRLPAELADVGPPDDPHAFLVRIAAVDHDHIDGWDQARQIGFDPLHVEAPFVAAVPSAMRISNASGGWPDPVPVP